MKRAVLGVVVAVGLLLHVVQLVDGWDRVRDAGHGRDFASYHYAVKAAAEGQDPYDKTALSALAKAEGTRNAVHPYFYPPPFLLTMAWVLPLSLEAAYETWFWLDSLFLLAALLALVKWRPGVPAIAMGAVLLASFTPLINNHVMGQANLPVVALVACGMLAERRGRGVLGGVLVGVACMLKMSPGLLVLWWLVRRQFRPAAAACVTAVVLTLASLPLVGLDGQLHFYTDVLPGLGEGDYNGLTVEIAMFGNHSIPNFFAQLWPGGRTTLSMAARVGSGITSLGLVAGAFWWLREPADDLDHLSALGALVVLMLVVPVYTYEHHVVFAVIPWVAVACAVWEGRLHRGWIAALAPAYVVAAWQLSHWKVVALAQGPLSEWAMQEAKSLSLLLLGVACLLSVRRSR
ncbi:MAG TPA: glycosyltransferase family 87 protein [Myxococcota bacterium]|nr:glycosyltransferase family 87 protein [Myxococcota bacterium]